jgi:SPP1 gp7 family putative phage head morphogenesis protein
MSLSKLRQTIAHYRAMLRAREATAEHALEYAHQQTLILIKPQLDMLYQAIQDKLDRGETVPLSWLYEQDRLTATAQMIERQINHFGALSQMQVQQLQSQGAYLGVQAGTALLHASVPAGVAWSFGIPSIQAVQNMVGATQIGSPLADLFSGFGAEAAQKASTALISGITLGYGPRQIAPSVQDALDISRNRALTISRTEMLRSYRDANLESFRANGDVVEKWRWTCDLSARTCAACLEMDGEEFPLDESMDSHVNCRCTMVPITASWDSILGPLGIDTSGMDDTSFTDDMQSGDEWFMSQDESVQRSILGNGKYDAWANGDFQLSDIVGHASDPVWGGSIYEKPLKELVK